MYILVKAWGDYIKKNNQFYSPLPHPNTIVFTHK